MRPLSRFGNNELKRPPTSGSRHGRDTHRGDKGRMGAHVDLDAMKRAAAHAAIAFVQPGTVIGVGTGTTATRFIEALAVSGIPVAGAVASSDETARRLEAAGIPRSELNDTGEIPLYVDGADEIDGRLRLIKGGGGALTSEKIVASSARLFVCIADQTKLVDRLGAFPLPVEVLPEARALVIRQLALLGGEAVVREGTTTDHGNIIIDVSGLDFADPLSLETILDRIPGVVECGVFARRPADVLLLGTAHGVRRIDRRPLD